MSTETHIEEKLKDRRAYRQTLIHKGNEIAVKVVKVEDEIKRLKEGKLVK